MVKRIEAFLRIHMESYVDPNGVKHVHFHVLPRYAEKRSFVGVEFIDDAWPAMVKIFTEQKPQLSSDFLSKMKTEIQKYIS